MGNPSPEKDGQLVYIQFSYKLKPEDEFKCIEGTPRDVVQLDVPYVFEKPEAGGFYTTIRGNHQKKENICLFDGFYKIEEVPGEDENGWLFLHMDAIDLDTIHDSTYCVEEPKSPIAG